MIFGTFDYLHPGHRWLIRHALRRVRDDKSPDAGRPAGLWIVVARDGNVLKIKGYLPVQNEKDRMEKIKKTFPDAQVQLGDPKNFLQPLKDIQPNVILLGYDQSLPPGITEEELGVAVERMKPFHPEKYKSSILRAKRRKGLSAETSD